MERRYLTRSVHMHNLSFDSFCIFNHLREIFIIKFRFDAELWRLFSPAQNDGPQKRRFILAAG